ncbi:sodium:solute symporter [Chryseosolibacter indicus]|uniref:Sodium:solute symporter n=1 Tax=Chryseosolibacter indicus TaxID=2782351 RepID=A0ABS5VVW4_9BACT|nr:sodium:solute symporter [Chryseosolibacter indicus]MBT1705564.1 sodium:solute symporter [Chryseosolibacter indicus]
MTPVLVLTIIVIYFAVLIFISIITSKGADTNTFFTANRQSPWYLVAFGMIGSSLSGVTFISVPGNVGKIGFGYFQVVLGYLVGYWVIIGILMPLYYRLNLVSIYTYLEQRFSFWSYKTGAFFFLISRTLGSALRLYLAATVLQLFLFDAWGVPFFVTVATTLILIWVYTFRGGVKTIVYTDAFQTLFLVSAVCIAVWQISDDLGWSFSEMVSAIESSKYSKMFYFDDVNSTQFFWKQFLGGMFITIAMTGLDQEIMQKNLTCKSLGEAQKNMFWFSITLVIVNLLFLTLGALLYFYTEANNLTLPAASDELFPRLALTKFSLLLGVFFLLGITASSYASADSALAGLTTSFCIDFLNFKDKPEPVKKKQKFIVHLGFSLLFLVIIVIFREINERSVIDAVLTVAGYTYGPLLGLFSFGVFTKLQVKDKFVPLVCVISPVLTYMISMNSEALLGGYKFGLEVLLVNGIITFMGLLLISKHSAERVTV